MYGCLLFQQFFVFIDLLLVFINLISYLFMLFLMVFHDSVVQILPVFQRGICLLIQSNFVRKSLNVVLEIFQPTKHHFFVLCVLIFQFFHLSVHVVYFFEPNMNKLIHPFLHPFYRDFIRLMHDMEFVFLYYGAPVCVSTAAEPERLGRLSYGIAFCVGGVGVVWLKLVLHVHRLHIRWIFSADVLYRAWLRTRNNR